MPYAKIIVAGSLLMLAASAGHAETAAGLNTGVSGSRAGLISEGGKATSTIDVKTSAVTSPKEAYSARAANSAGTQAYARNRGDRDQQRTEKKKKKTASPNWGFSSFVGTGRTRY